MFDQIFCKNFIVSFRCSSRCSSMFSLRCSSRNRTECRNNCPATISLMISLMISSMISLMISLMTSSMTLLRRLSDDFRQTTGRNGSTKTPHFQRALRSTDENTRFARVFGAVQVRQSGCGGSNRTTYGINSHYFRATSKHNLQRRISDEFLKTTS